MWDGEDVGYRDVGMKMKCIGECGGHNQCTLSLVEHVFPTFIRELIFHIFKELVFLEKILTDHVKI